MPPVKLADRARRIAPSATMAVDAKAKEMQRAGINVVSFGAGEPDFPTPPHVKEAASRAIGANFTKYTPVGGIPELREAIAQRLKEDDGLDYRPEQIVVGNGAKDICYSICQVLLQAGDEAIIPAPYWVSYAEQVALADARPVIVPTREESGFKISAAQLEAAITGRTRLVILNSPCNPTGAVYTAAELRALGEVLERHPEVMLLTDEIYKKIAYGEDGRAPSAAAVLAHLAEQVILVDGASKAYSMTGWRIGFAAGPSPLMAAMRSLQSHSTSGAASISQKAAVAAFAGDQGEVERMRGEFQRRRDTIVAALNAMPGVRCSVPGGAFYAFPNVQGALGRTYRGSRVDTSLDLATYLLEEAHVALAQGEAFGAPGYLRLSYATSLEQINEGMRRMADALAAQQVGAPA
jgi:aspartate aminotransferase